VGEEWDIQQAWSWLKELLRYPAFSVGGGAGSITAGQPDSEDKTWGQRFLFSLTVNWLTTSQQVILGFSIDQSCLAVDRDRPLKQVYSSGTTQ